MRTRVIRRSLRVSVGRNLPRIAVILPVFNRAHAIRRAVDSVLAQEFEDFELIVVDDASTDGSAEVVAGIDDPRIRLLRHPRNLGGNAARNLGIRSASAPIICFLDSDDAYLPDKLTTVTTAFRTTPGLEGLIDSFRKTYPGRTRAPVDRHNPDLADSEDILVALFHRRIWKSTPSISVTREAAIRAGLFDETLKRRQDFDFLVRLLRTAHFASTGKVDWIKTDSVDGISADLDGYMQSMVAFWDRHPEYHDNPAYRGGFAADLARHFSKLLVRGRFGGMARAARPVVERIGWSGLAGNLVRGVGELRRLKRERRSA